MRFAAIVGLALFAAPALAADLEQKPRIGTAKTFYARTFIVDGLPIYREDVRIWTGRDWAQLESDDADRALKGLPPIPYPRE